MTVLKLLADVIDEQWNNIKIAFAETWTIPWSIPAGERDDYEIFLLEKGEGIFSIGGQEFKVTPGDMVFLYSMWGNAFHPNEGSSFRFVFVTFKFAVCLTNSKIKSLNEALTQEIFPWHIGDDQEYVQLFYQLHHEKSLGSNGYRFRMKLMLGLLITKIANTHEHGEKSNNLQLAINPATRESVDRVIVFMQKNYRNKINLDELGKLVNLNSRYLCTLFKQIIGQTLVEYLTDIRIEKAKRLLLYTSLSITDIALDIGFSNSQYFSRVFSRSEGMSPREYRKRRGER